MTADPRRYFVRELVGHGYTDRFSNFSLAKYLGTPRKIHAITTPQTRQLVRRFKKANPSLSQKELVEVVSSLYAGETFTERSIASLLLEAYPKLRIGLDVRHLDAWLSQLTGWAEIDGLCQSTFSATEVLANWENWKILLKEFNKSNEISKRRASLVLLRKPVSQSTDPRLSDLAFANIDRLRSERDILITKAISWLLRSLITLHKPLVEAYLTEHAAELPPIAVRETRNKLLTGKK